MPTNPSLRPHTGQQHSGGVAPRVPGRAPLILGLVATLVAAGGAAFQVSQQGGTHKGASGARTSVLGRDPIEALQIGPVAGLTLNWHIAPEAVAVPLGTTLEFRQEYELGARVTWNGATESVRGICVCQAIATPVGLGPHTVNAVITHPDGTTNVNTCTVNVVDVAPENIHVSLALSVTPHNLTEQSSNAETVSVFFGFPSVAALRDLGNGQYRTSCERDVQLVATVDPPVFASIMEFRVGDLPPALGPERTIMYVTPGVRQISVGPPAAPALASLETYRTTITSHHSAIDYVREGEPIAFSAVTDPPGYESEITWISSTLFGSATPVLGEGATFTATFRDTWGLGATGSLKQWLGARADNAVFNQDDADNTEIVQNCEGLAPCKSCIYKIICVVVNNGCPDFVNADRSLKCNFDTNADGTADTPALCIACVDGGDGTFSCQRVRPLIKIGNCVLKIDTAPIQAGCLDCPTGLTLLSGFGVAQLTGDCTESTHRCKVKSFDAPKNRTGCVKTAGVNVVESFEMDAEFEPECACCEYRQFVKGKFEYDGAKLDHKLCDYDGNGTPDSLSETSYTEDGAQSGATCIQYGHRVPGPGFSDNGANDVYSMPNRATGCKYDGFDSPGMRGLTAGKTYNMDLAFKGQIIDTCCNNKIVQEKTWTVQCSGTAAPSRQPVKEAVFEVWLAGEPATVRVIAWDKLLLTVVVSIPNGDGLIPIDASELDVRVSGLRLVESPPPGRLFETRLGAAVAHGLYDFDYPPEKFGQLLDVDVSFRGVGPVRVSVQL